MICLYVYKYYSAIKNEILLFAAMYMDLENTMLSEISQTEKDKYYTISLICGILKNNTNEYKTETESQT